MAQASCQSHVAAWDLGPAGPWTSGHRLRRGAVSALKHSDSDHLQRTHCSPENIRTNISYSALIIGPDVFAEDRSTYIDKLQVNSLQAYNRTGRDGRRTDASSPRYVTPRPAGRVHCHRRARQVWEKHPVGGAPGAIRRRRRRREAVQISWSALTHPRLRARRFVLSLTDRPATAHAHYRFPNFQCIRTIPGRSMVYGTICNASAGRKTERRPSGR